MDYTVNCMKLPDDIVTVAQSDTSIEGHAYAVQAQLHSWL